ncbi:MAG: deoxyguanosinetriphosphate triphosphohydrolase [Yaniella sp.]|nr:deoxyguanosinetriphosphate triphosphohydrolase [Yaniella sp.]MDN5730771.1 deoxyguanosinetriphosphate triphosphohydrolase [Yaniella sp.]MDN5815265.1 deoxyguanosinetriphosphate triphosphohydrolase [Yaniella sp.]MDN5816724.1 deoxyguanosinetriphosphate triphosphohydrolase [Yaniella sp.]MDN5837651.1 deoxyguanosinetriphosphate triphosphohydrolase [Yaniella sp.]
MARWVPEPKKSTYRSDFERDRARILHSAALRRLAAKTQVVSPGDDDFIRNRLTHSLEVAQVGREFGRSLGCDPDVVEAACLSHDLGHPPFGHNGEKALDEAAAEIGGFEGNAQTLRLLSRLEPKKMTDHGTPAGLNLTRAALDAATKYPWLKQDAPLKSDGKPTRKFGVYDDDEAVFNWFREGVGTQRLSMEAQVMDLADDVSYCVHDVEDGIVSGMFQLGWLTDPEQRAGAIETTRQWYLPATELEAIEAALSRLEATPTWVMSADGARNAHAALKDMTSQLIGRFSTAAFEATRDAYGNDPLTRHTADVIVPEETEIEIATMKGIAAHYVMSSARRQPLYEAQREILLELVEFLLNTDAQFLEPMHAQDWRAAPNDAVRKRVVIDQVASLTDTSALVWHGNLVRGTAQPTTLPHGMQL